MRSVAPSGIARALPIVLAIAFVAVALAYWIDPDDAYIGFRYAENLAGGIGLVFNPGERVEGYTTALWVLLLALLRKIGLAIPPTAHVLAAVAGGACVLVAARVARRFGDGAAVLAALLTALFPGFLFWSAAAMETSTFALFMLLAMSEASFGGAGRAGFYAGLATLARPEGALVAAAAAAMKWTDTGWRAATRVVAFAALVVVPYEVFRLAYFGDPLPNTFYQKGTLNPLHGLWYAAQFALGGGWILGVAALALRGRARRPLWPWVVLGAIYASYVVLVGGDFYAFHRFFAPLVPLLAVPAAVALEPLLAGRGRMAAWAMLGLWAVCVGRAFVLADGTARGMAAVAIYERTIGRALRDALPPGTTVAMTGVGIAPYEAGTHIRVLDMLGVVDRHIAHDGAHVVDGLPAHLRYDGAYVLSRRPDVIFAGDAAACVRPLTAAALRSDPCWFQLLYGTGIEVGMLGRRCARSSAAPPSCTYELPADMDLRRPELRRVLEQEYEANPPGLRLPVTVYVRRDRKAALLERPS
jgi:hypothetical protein